MSRALADDRHTKLLVILVLTAFAVSVVHYLDNYFNYEAYPQPGPGGPPAPSATLVALGWFVFTAFGIIGMQQWFRGRNRIAALALTVYSTSGLIGFGHYTIPGATDMVWWRQGHVILDILCGIAILAFALWAVLRLPAVSLPDATREPARHDAA